MDQSTSVILAAAITGIIGPTITIIIKRLFDEKFYPKADKERINHLEGKWFGQFKQFVGKDVYRDLEVISDLSIKGKKVSGKAVYIFVDGKYTELKLYNGSFNGHILKIEYEGNLGVFHRGSMILEMNPNGDKLNGRFIGYSPNFKQIIGGDISMGKQPIQK